MIVNFNSPPAERNVTLLVLDAHCSVEFLHGKYSELCGYGPMHNFKTQPQGVERTVMYGALGIPKIGLKMKIFQKCHQNSHTYNNNQINGKISRYCQSYCINYASRRFFKWIDKSTIIYISARCDLL